MSPEDVLHRLTLREKRRWIIGWRDAFGWISPVTHTGAIAYAPTLADLVEVGALTYTRRCAAARRAHQVVPLVSRPRYTCIGPVSGGCLRVHRTLPAALKCLSAAAHPQIGNLAARDRRLYLVSHAGILQLDGAPAIGLPQESGQARG